MTRETNTFDRNPVVSLTPDALVLGAESFRWSQVRAFGVSVVDAGVTVGRVRFARVGMGVGYLLTLALIDSHSQGTVERQVIISSHEDELVKTLQVTLPDKWQGVASFFAMRKRLGFSNKATYWAIAAILAFTLAAVAAIVWYSMAEAKAKRENQRPGTHQLLRLRR